MIKVSVLYPNENDFTFDHDYFLNTHMPLVADRLGDALLGYEVDQGLSAAEPDKPPAYLAWVHMSFNSVDDFHVAFEPVAEELLGDMPNYTNATPTIQISEFRGRYPSVA